MDSLKNVLWKIAGLIAMPFAAVVALFSAAFLFIAIVGTSLIGIFKLWMQGELGSEFKRLRGKWKKGMRAAEFAFGEEENVSDQSEAAKAQRKKSKTKYKNPLD